MRLQVRVAGPLQAVPQVVHPPLRLSDLHRDPEVPLQVHRHRRPIPLGAMQPNRLRGLFQVPRERLLDLGG
jgi:hypothetical protein